MTKEPLTREKIKQDLRSKQMRRITGEWIILLTFLFILGIFLAIAITQLVFSILLLCTIIFVSTPFLIFTVFLCYDYSLLHKINKGDFCIIEDRLVDMKAEYPDEPALLIFRILLRAATGFGLRRRYHMGKIMSFAEQGDYLTKHQDKSVYGYSIRGDMFYVAILKGKRKKLVGVYNQRVYELKDKIH